MKLTMLSLTLFSFSVIAGGGGPTSSKKLLECNVDSDHSSAPSKLIFEREEGDTFYFENLKIIFPETSLTVRATLQGSGFLQQHLFLRNNEGRIAAMAGKYFLGSSFRENPESITINLQTYNTGKGAGYFILNNLDIPFSLNCK